MSYNTTLTNLKVALVFATLFGLSLQTSLAIQIVEGPGDLDACFSPKNAETPYLQWKAQKGPYKIAFIFGYVGNLWRDQLVSLSETYAKSPEIADKIAEFRVVEESISQPSAIEDLMDEGFHAVILLPSSEVGFERIIRRAKRKNFVITTFGADLGRNDVLFIDQDHWLMGELMGKHLMKELKAANVSEGKILELRGVLGAPADKDRSAAFRAQVNKSGGHFEIVKYVGGWHGGTTEREAQKALEKHDKFVAILTQAAGERIVPLLLKSGHPLVPIAGEAENEYRKLIAQYAEKGLKGYSIGHTPANGAAAIKVTVAALEGKKVLASALIPGHGVSYEELKADVNYFPNASKEFYVVPPLTDCNINLSHQEFIKSKNK